MGHCYVHFAFLFTLSSFFEYLRCNEVQFSQSTFTCNEVVLVNYFLLFTSLHLIYFSYLFRYMKSENWPDSLIATHSSTHTSGAGFMNRRRLCQLTAAILTSDLTTHMWVL